MGNARLSSVEARNSYPIERVVAIFPSDRWEKLYEIDFGLCFLFDQAPTGLRRPAGPSAPGRRRQQGFVRPGLA
jgi:hypothetical protein